MNWNSVLYHVGRADNVTHCEQAHGTRNTGFEIVKKSEDVVFFRLKKSDGTFSLKVAMRVDKFRDDWLLLNLSENQIVALAGDLKQIYDGVQDHNSKVCAARAEAG